VVTHGYGKFLQAGNHLFESSSLKRYVINWPGARILGVTILISEMHNGLVAEIKPVARRLKGWARSNRQAQNVHVEVARGF
jgi:hypothetical protein